MRGSHLARKCLFCKHLLSWHSLCFISIVPLA